MIHKDIQKQMQEAMKEKDSTKLNTLRGLLTAFTNELVTKGEKPSGELSDEDVMSVIKRAVKQRKDSIEQFRKGGRDDLATNEELELKILEGYLPASMPREEIEKVVKAKIAELGVTDKSKIGVLIGAVMKELKGQVDGNDVKDIIDSLLK